MAKSEPIVMYGRQFPDRREFVRFLKQQTEAIVAKEYPNIPRGLLSGLIEQESSWGWDTRKKRANRNGTMDYGLTQINQVNLPAYNIKDPAELERDPILAIRIGADILSKRLLARGGNVPLALADYNAGPGTVNRFLEGKRDLPEITQKYIMSVPFRAVKYGGELPTLQQVAYIRDKLKVAFNPEQAMKQAGLLTGGNAARVKTDQNVPTKDDRPFVVPEVADSIIAADAVEAMKEFGDTGPMLAGAGPIDLGINEPKASVPTVDTTAFALPEVSVPKVKIPKVEDPLALAFGGEKSTTKKREASVLDVYLDGLIDEVVG